MNNNPDNSSRNDIRGLYDFVTEVGRQTKNPYPLSFQDFSRVMQKESNRRGLYDKLSKRAGIGGTYEDFEKAFFNPYASATNQVEALRGKTFTLDPRKEMARQRALMDASRGEYNPYGTSEVSYNPDRRMRGTEIAPIDLVDSEDTLPEIATSTGPKTTRTFGGGVVSGLRGIHGGAQIAVADLLKGFGGNSDDEREAIHLINRMEQDGTLSLDTIQEMRKKLGTRIATYTPAGFIYTPPTGKIARQLDALNLIEERMQRMGQDLTPEKRAVALDAMRSDLSEKGASEDKANPFVRWKEGAKDYMRKSEVPEGVWAELGSATASVGGAIAGQAISMIPGAAPIGQAISWASIGAQTVSSGGQAIMDMEDYAAEKGVYITPEDKATIALGYMATEFGGDALGGAVASKSISAIGKLAGGRLGKKLAVRSLAKGIAGNEGVRQSLSSLSEYAQKPLAIPLAKSAGRQIVRGAVTEGPGESLTTLMQNGALDRVWKDKEDQEAWSDVAKQAVKDGIYGAWAGALMGGFGSAIQSGQVAHMHRKEGLTLVQDEKNNLYEVIGSDQSGYLVLDQAGRQKMLPADQVVDAIHYTPQERKKSQKAYDEATEGLHPKEEVLTENQKRAGAILSATEQQQSPIYRATHPEVAEEDLNSPVALAGAKQALADVMEGQNEEVKARVDQMALVLRDGEADPTEELTKLFSDESLSDNDRQSILDVVTAQSRLAVLERSHQEAKAQMQRELTKEWIAKSVVGDETARGAVISATITDADGKPKQVYVTGGVRVVTNEDGTEELLPTDDDAPIYVYDESVDGDEKGHIVQMDDLSSPQLVAEDYLDLVQASLDEVETAFRSEVQAADWEATKQKYGVKLSEEVDENGKNFVLNSEGEKSFGQIPEGLEIPAGDILLSEGDRSEDGGENYGLKHIEDRHGFQIRNAGYRSVVDFVEYVASHYDRIKKGTSRNGEPNGTYLLQLIDGHHNTIYVELSQDGTYWRINSAGVFNDTYGNNKETIRPASEVQIETPQSQNTWPTPNDKSGYSEDANGTVYESSLRQGKGTEKSKGEQEDKSGGLLIDHLSIRGEKGEQPQGLQSELPTDLYGKGTEKSEGEQFLSSLPRTREGEVDGLKLMSERPDDFIRYLGQLYGEDFVASLPLSKSGALDLKALTPEQTLKVNEAALGKSGAVEAARQRRSKVGAERSKLEAEVKSDLGNLEKRMALRKASEEYRLYDDYVRTAEEQARQELEARRRAEEEALTPEERQKREEEKRRKEQEIKDREERIRLENERRRREREELERNAEGSTVREYTEDPPRQARARGARLVNGEVVRRQEPMTVEHYADAERAFSQRPGETRVPVKRTIVEAESLQASHKEGRMNPRHFIPEAQPKDRADNGLSSTAADRIASDIRPDEITGGITAYTGAPVVNGRGEVIQGNNRTDALQTMYDGEERHAKSAERYKEYLKAHASEYGMTAEQVEAMNHPVAVDVAEVSDSEAIRLGHRGQTDLESAGADTMNAQTVGEELNSDTDPQSGQSMLVSFFNRIFNRTGANGAELSAKMDNMLNRNAEEGLQFLHENGYLTDTQYKNAFETNSEGKRVVTAEAKTALKDVALYQLADVIGPRAMDIFYRLPASARNGLATFLYRDSQASFETSLAPDLGDALLVWDSLRQDPDFAGLTNFESAKIFILGKVSLFGRSELETNLGEASSLAKLLAASMQTQTEEQIAGALNQYYDLVGANATGAKTQSLMPTSQPTDTKAGAAEAVYGRVYEVPSGREKHYRFRRDVAEDFRARRDALADRITEERRKHAAAMDMSRTFGVPMKLHEDMSTLPEEVRAGFDETHFVKGWFYKGDNAIHIYLPANVDADDVRATFLHEAVGHYGCRELLGEVGYNQVLDGIASKLGEEEVLRAMKGYCDGSQDLADRVQVRIAMDEWIAHRAESGITKKTVWESIKDFFRKVFGLSGKQINQSAEMMADDLLRRSAENLQKRAERQQEVATEVSPERAEVRFRSNRSAADFARLRDAAIEQKGLVAPDLNQSSVKVTHVMRHDFTGTGLQAIEKAMEWAQGRIVKDHWYHKGMSDGFKYLIDGTSVEKYLSESSTTGSDNLGVHLATLKVLPRVINRSILAETHPDYGKVNGRRSAENGVNNPNLLVHRLYGAIEIDGQLYRVKTTLHERYNADDRAYDYMVTNMELVISGSSTSNALTSSTNKHTSTERLAVAKLLKGVEKSYESGKLLLDESENTGSEEETTRFRRAERAGDVSGAAEAVSDFMRNATPKNTSVDDVLRFLRVYHNSPHLLKKADGSFVDPETGERLGFDHRFMGSGEGFQAHGWGSYFSVKDLEEYATPSTNVFNGMRVTQNEAYVISNGGSTHTAYLLFLTIRDCCMRSSSTLNEKTVKKAVKEDLERMIQEEELSTKREGRLLEALKDNEPWAVAAINPLQESTVTDQKTGYRYTAYSGYSVENVRGLYERARHEVDSYKEILAFTERNPDYVEHFASKIQRHKYVVEIPDPDTNHYIEEDRRLTKHEVEMIRDALNDNPEAKDSPLVDKLRRGCTGREAYELLSLGLGEEQASRLLNKAGFVGIHYNGKYDGECHVIFNESDAKITDHYRFRRQKAHLAGVHTLTTDNLRHALKMGGLANPSIAVYDTDRGLPTRTFGEVALIAPRDLVDAKTGRHKGTYNRDSWSPVYPRIAYDLTEKGHDLMRELDKKRGEREGSLYALHNLVMEEPKILDKDYFIKLLSVDQQIKELYRSESPSIPFDQYVEKIAEPILKERQEMLYAGQNPNGSKRYVPHTLENVSKMMNEDFSKIAPWDLFMQSLVDLSEKHKSLESIRRHEDRMAGMDESLYKKVEKEFHNLAEELVSEKTETMYPAEPAKKLQALIVNNDNRYGRPLTVTEEARVSALREQMKALPTDYFETKVDRPVGLDEFVEAVVPEGTSPELVSELGKSGFKVSTYDSTKEGAMNEAVLSAMDRADATDRGVRFRTSEQNIEEVNRTFNEQLRQSTVNEKQKKDGTQDVVSGSDIRFRATKRAKETIDGWLNKRSDLTEEDKATFYDEIKDLDNKGSLAAGRWFANGRIRLPEDMAKVKQALLVAEQAKVDPIQYESPMDLINTHSEVKLKEKPIDPETIPTLHRARSFDNGLVIYDVDESEESRMNMRAIINTHFGEDASPWCLLQGDGRGNLMPESRDYWEHYNAYPKQVAFVDGKLTAFSANDNTYVRVWWDRQDKCSQAIPIANNVRVENDPLERTADKLFEPTSRTNAYKNVHKGDPSHGNYEEWYDLDHIKLRMDRDEDGRLTRSTLWTPEGHLSSNMERTGDVKKNEHYYSNGEVRDRTVLVADKQQSYEKWHPDGGRWEAVHFTYNKDGYYSVAETWWRDGRRMSKVEYKNGLKDGEAKYWSHNGSLSVGLHHQGSRTGVWKFYSEKGLPLYDVEYIPNGTLEPTAHTVQTYDREGDPIKKNEEDTPETRFRRAERAGDVGGAAEAVSDFKRNATPKNTTIDDVLRFKRVYHNSPHLLKKADGSFVDPETGERLGFDHRFMGSGEGAQAHGWGSYFSVKDLEGYGQTEQLIPYEGMPEMTISKDDLSQYTDEQKRWAEMILDLYNDGEGDVGNTFISPLERLYSDRSAFDELYDSQKEANTRWDDFVDFCKNRIEEDVRPFHNKYVVEIPNLSDGNYLEEDAPLSENQTSAIKQTMEEKSGSEYDENFYSDFANSHPDWDTLSGGTLYKTLSDYILKEYTDSLSQAAQWTSEMLNEAGFVGIHYNGQRDGECYVIFNEKDAKITEHIRFRRTERTDPKSMSDPINPQWDGEWYSPEDLTGKSTADLLELPSAPATPEKRPMQSVAEYAETMSRHYADPRVRFRTGAHKENLRAPQPPRITDGMSLYEVAQLQHEYNRNYRDYLGSSMKRMDALVTTKGRFIRYMVDSARPVELFCKEMERMGVGMTPEQNVYQDLMTQSSRELNMRKQEVEPLVTKLTDRIRDLREQKLLDGVMDVSYTFKDEDTEITEKVERADGYEKVSLYFRAKDIVECEQLGLVSRGREGFEKVVTEAGKESTHITPEAYIASFEAAVGKANAEELCDDMRKMSRWSIDRLHGAGLMTDDQYRSLTQSPRRYYAPQRGFKVTEESDRNAYERVEMTAEGRQSLSGDPIAYMQAIMNTTVMRVVRNQDLLHLYEWVTQHQKELARRGVLEIGETYYRKAGVDEKGNPIYVPSKQAPTIEELRHDADARRQIAKLRMEQKRLDQSNDKGETADYVYKVKSKEISDKISDLNNSIEILYRDPIPLREDSKEQTEALRRTVKVYKDGVEQQIHFSPQYRGELVADVLNGRPSIDKNSRFYQSGWGELLEKSGQIKFFSKATRLMSALMTQYNPTFAVTNALRDYGTALISNVSDFGWGYQRDFMANYAKVQTTVLKYAMSDAYSDGSYPPGKYGTYLKEFFDEGAATGWSFLPDVVKIRQTMKEMSDPSLKQKFVNGKFGVANAFGLKQGIGMITEASELNTRFAEYVTSRERGYSKKEAAKHAKELTVNFNRKGTLAGFFGSLFGFWNASIQGTNKIVRLGKHGAEWCGTLFAGGLAQGLLYALGAPDKDDERAFTEWEMMTNICIGDFKIPLPQGFRGFWGVGVQMALVLAGKKDWQGGVIDGTQFLLGELLPSEAAALANIIEWDDVTGSVVLNPKKVARDVMPTAIQPEMDVILNMDFMGNPVYREPFIQSQEGQIAQRTLGKKRTKQVYKDLSDKIWYAMGGSLERNDRMSRDGTHILPDGKWLNPSVIEHVFEGRTTGIGKTMADIATCVSAYSSGDLSELRKLQIVNVLTKQEKDYSDSDRDYWKLMDFYRSRQQTMSNLRKAKEGEDLERYREMTRRVSELSPRMTGEQLTEKIWEDGTQDEKLYVTWLETKALLKQIDKGTVTKEEVAPTIDRLKEQFRELR